MSLLLLNRDWRGPSRGKRDGPIVVGLVNNMPDAALRSTDRQFSELLSSAAGRGAVSLRIFSDRGIPRSDAARQYLRDRHAALDELWRADLDGLIVTGTEPRATDLADEPCWPTMTRLADWATERDVPSMWSCLAAHAAVRYFDGIGRRPRRAKLFGVFDCVKTGAHPLVGHGPARWCTPHSRLNEIPAAQLAAAGYDILATAPEAGADIFARQGKSLLLFLQGHPEYDAAALLREYRRDIDRFLAGAHDSYPEMPRGYFAEAATDALLSFRERALRERGTALLSSFPTTIAEQNLRGQWRGAATRLFANWLSYLAEQTARRSERSPSRRAIGAAGKPAFAYG